MLQRFGGPAAAIQLAAMGVEIRQRLPILLGLPLQQQTQAVELQAELLPGQRDAQALPRYGASDGGAAISASRARTSAAGPQRSSGSAAPSFDIVGKRISIASSTFPGRP